MQPIQHAQHLQLPHNTRTTYIDTTYIYTTQYTFIQYIIPIYNIYLPHIYNTIHYTQHFIHTYI